MSAIYMNTHYLPLENVKSAQAFIEVALLRKWGRGGADIGWTTSPVLWEFVYL